MAEQSAVRSTIRTNSASGMTSGIVTLGHLAPGPATPRQMVHDGDTVAVRGVGNLSIRLLGIDTPEISLSVADRNFMPLSDPIWNTFLADPFDESLWKPFGQPLSPDLRRWLASRVGERAGSTHFAHARFAETTFEAEIVRDQQAMMKTDADFQFFLVFGYDVMDGYGRLLCLINRDQPDRDNPGPRPPSYNHRLLETGRAFPYFIWPNINPWKKKESAIDAVIPPGAAWDSMAENEDLQRSRSAVQNARAKHLGVFDAMDPCLLEPFELRFLARREPPGRYVIDLSRNDDVLIHPQNYFTIPNPEDRLFVSPIHVPLFVEHGWKRQPLNG